MYFKALIVLAITSAVQAAVLKKCSITCPDGSLASNVVCCKFFALATDLQTNLFDSGKCDEEVHEALCLTFHDAAGFLLVLAAQGLPV
ncbi:class II peroxidase [Sphaerobolus stellatus SS14]|uniref:Class II peroxidase n=1 Tax=Sphaerobolus stellatus (strain SS14) TaxID=990650 RepID=A0A0C9VBB1_SPHS4|nr:class II peroxidase [Sphaerobolus stellatus SS14]